MNRKSVLFMVFIMLFSTFTFSGSQIVVADGGVPAAPAPASALLLEEDFEGFDEGDNWGMTASVPDQFNGIITEIEGDNKLLLVGDNLSGTRDAVKDFNPTFQDDVILIEFDWNVGTPAGGGAPGAQLSIEDSGGNKFITLQYNRFTEMLFGTGNIPEETVIDSTEVGSGFNINDTTYHVQIEINFAKELINLTVTSLSDSSITATHSGIMFALGTEYKEDVGKLRFTMVRDSGNTYWTTWIDNFNVYGYADDSGPAELDFSELEGLLADAKAMTNEDEHGEEIYTPESFAALQNMIVQTETALNEKQITTQSELNQAITNLTIAMRSLVQIGCKIADCTDLEEVLSENFEGLNLKDSWGTSTGTAGGSGSLTATVELVDGNQVLQFSGGGTGVRSTQKIFPPITNEMVVLGLDWNVGSPVNTIGAQLSFEDSNGNRYLTLQHNSGAELIYSTGGRASNTAITGPTIGTGFDQNDVTYNVQVTLNFVTTTIDLLITNLNDPSQSVSINDIPFPTDTDYNYNFGKLQMNLARTADTSAWTTWIDNVHIYEYAGDGIEPPILDFTDFDTKISTAKSISNDEGTYTKASFNVLDDAITRAEHIRNQIVTSHQLGVETQELQNAINGLVLLQVKVDAFEELIQTTKSVENTDDRFTTTSFDALQVAIAHAEAYLDGAIIEDELDVEHALLFEVYDSLEPVEAKHLMFDFGSAQSKVVEGYTLVTPATLYSLESGFGLSRSLDSRDRGGPDDLRSEFVIGKDYTFRVNLPNGSYYVNVIAGDNDAGNRTGLVINGVGMGDISSSAGEFAELSVLTTVDNGKLIIHVTSSGDGRLNAVEIIPMSFIESLQIDNITIDQQSAVELSWDPVADAESYNIYRKLTSEATYDYIGNTLDSDYSDASVELGYSYNYAITYVTEDQIESILSNTVTAHIFDDEVTVLEAPTGLQLGNVTDSSATIAWDADDDAIIYYVYRSRFEDANFTKIGEANQASYTDHSITPYNKFYYRVSAVNAGGVSDQSTSLELLNSKDRLRQMEAINRALVAIHTDNGNYIGWRMLGTDPDSVSFNLYRDGELINDTPITTSTNFVDDTGTIDSEYYVEVIGGNEAERTETVSVWSEQYLSIPLDIPDGGQTPAGEHYTYSANDGSVGDLDGDGEYEIILKWDPSNAKDNSHSGYTGNVYIDAYKLDGTKLWRIDLGHNIRAGAHYTQFLVYDFDGDGKAEIVMKTADGTIDGQGNVIGDAHADYRQNDGYILSGPEYLTIFDGETGRALHTIDYYPPRGNVGDWGDTYGNRVDRFLAGVAYLDGVHPSIVMARGYYTRTVLAAYDFVNGQLQQRWVFDSDEPGNGAYAGQGSHSLSVADVDGDGFDEIIYGAAVIDHDGKGLYSLTWGHGDALHVSDFDPDRPGLEVFQTYENRSAPYGFTLTDAETGEVIGGEHTGEDTGRGLIADIDPRHKGAEYWASDSWDGTEGVSGVYSVNGDKITAQTPKSINHAVWWDGDLLRELLDHDFNQTFDPHGYPKIDKWDWINEELVNIYRPEGTRTSNGTKGNPVLQADLFGDWREEVIWASSDSSELQIHTTIDPTEHRIFTLMHDPTYRLAVAWQNVGYNQPPHPGFYIGVDMDEPPKPLIYTVGTELDDQTDPTVPDRSVIPVQPEQQDVYHLEKNDDGQIIIQVGSGKHSVTFPAQGSALDEEAVIRIISEELSIDIPNEVIAQLRETVADELLPGARISYGFEPIDDETLISQASERHHVMLSAGGQVYRLSLSIIDITGTRHSVTQFDQPLRLSFKLNEDVNPDLLGIYYIADDGELTYVGGIISDGYMTADINHFSYYGVLAYDKIFSDVATSFWAHDIIKSLTAKHIIKGINDEEFAPLREITRAEFAALIARTLDLKASSAPVFADVQASDWFAQDVAAAYEAGIITGHSVERFAPQAPITRQEMAVILQRAYEHVTGTVISDTESQPFADENEVAPWALQAVRHMQSLGFIEGRGDKMFVPLGQLNRAESAKVIALLHTLYINQ